MFDAEKFIKNAVRETKETVAGTTIIALSGGVDSSTCAMLVGRVIGKNLVCVFVDTGFMRKNEPERIREIFETKVKFEFADASERFFDALKGITDPEKKRKIIAKVYIEIFNEYAEKYNAKFLVQGTIAPDWIETNGNIKSHHNVALPSGMTLEIYEPMKDLYKNEVRQVARALGLSEEISERMPFPGPGLAVRVLGEVTKEKVEIVKEADAIVREEILKANLKVWQAFAVLLEGKATGVKGDKRDYGYMIAVRIVESTDAMTANAMNVKWEILQKITNRITTEISNVTRVLYDLTSKPPATIEFE
ncbi:MAG: glutamine-hydrolyzing GMP synthase [Candidatus Altarchaeum sp.]|nr:glutamine-hydrolyzing GMP synthase [Candidatus Altarchaeum sp.]